MNCLTCKKLLDDPQNPIRSMNCGGDCLTCMAEAGDPDCIKSLAELGDKKWIKALEEIK